MKASEKALMCVQLYADVQVWVCADGSGWWDWPVFAHSCICMCIYVCVNTGMAVPCMPASSTWLCCHNSGSCCERPCRLAEGRPSLRLTQAKRGFLHIFCHTIWALVSVAAPLRTHLAAHSADGHLLFPTSWWREKTTSNRPSFLTLCYAFLLHAVTQSVIFGGSNRKNIIIIYHNCIECT